MRAGDFLKKNTDGEEPKNNPEPETLAADMHPDMRDAWLEVANWLPSESDEFKQFYFQLLASFPTEKAEELQDMGYESLADGMLGWQELRLIMITLDAIDDAGMHKDWVDALLRLDGEDEQ